MAARVRANQAYRERYPDKARARKAVEYEMRMGRMVRQPCLICGMADGVHAHHDDYSKPLEVMWLCDPHHKDRHRLIGEIPRGAATHPFRPRKRAGEKGAQP